MAAVRSSDIQALLSLAPVEIESGKLLPSIPSNQRNTATTQATIIEGNRYQNLIATFPHDLTRKIAEPMTTKLRRLGLRKAETTFRGSDLLPTWTYD